MTTEHSSKKTFIEAIKPFKNIDEEIIIRLYSNKHSISEKERWLSEFEGYKFTVDTVMNVKWANIYFDNIDEENEYIINKIVELIENYNLTQLDSDAFETHLDFGWMTISWEDGYSELLKDSFHWMCDISEEQQKEIKEKIITKEYDMEEIGESVECFLAFKEEAIVGISVEYNDVEHKYLELSQ